jgi:hypothetical protein
MFAARRDYIVIKPDRAFWEERYQYEDEAGNTKIYPVESGVVVTLGKGTFSCGVFEPINDLEIGDRVFFERRNTDILLIDGCVHVVIREYDTIGLEKKSHKEE